MRCSSRIRIAETQKGVTRVVLDLEQHAEFTASQLSGPNRLMIELRSERSPGAAAHDASVSGRESVDRQPRAGGAKPDMSRGSLRRQSPGRGRDGWPKRVLAAKALSREKLEPPAFRAAVVPSSARGSEAWNCLPQPPAAPRRANRVARNTPSLALARRLSPRSHRRFRTNPPPDRVRCRPIDCDREWARRLPSQARDRRRRNQS